MIRDSTAQPLSKIGVIFMKRQERYHRSVEIFNVLGLGLVSAASIRRLALGVALGRSLGFQFATDPLDGLRRAHTPREKIFRPFFS